MSKYIEGLRGGGVSDNVNRDFVVVVFLRPFKGSFGLKRKFGSIWHIFTQKRRNILKYL